MTVGDLSATQPSRIRRALRWLAAPLKPFFVALFPDRARPEILAGRYGAPLLAVIMCSCVAAFALGTRLDVGPAVRADSAGEASGSNAKPEEIKTDREIDEEIAKRTAVTRVKLGLGAALATPMQVFALALALLLLARYVGGRPTMPRTMTVAAIAAVPGAVHSLITAFVAWRQPRVFPDELGSLVTSPLTIDHPLLGRLLAGVDVFTLWSVVLVAVGLCAAAEIKPRKSIAAVTIGFLLYLVVTRIIMGGGR